MARPALVPWSLFALATAGVLLLTVENLALARRLGRAELDARGPAASLARLQADDESLRAANQRLEDEARNALARAAGATDLVEDRIAAEAAAREQRLAAQRAVNAPMPEGVVVCLRAITERLRADGFQGLRFLSARSLEDFELRTVELLDTGPDGLVTTLYSAARMTAVLDRTRNELVLRLFDGHRRCGSDRHELPAEGLPLVFRTVDGPAWEERLPYLVRAEGSYPPPAAATAAKDRVDLDTRLAWQDRLNLVLERAGTASRLRVKGFRGMRDGWFLQASLAGYDDKGRLCLQAMVSELCVEVDDKTGTAQLCLKDGTLIGAGGESHIAAEGYRILLPALKPAQASDAMLGIVVRR